MAGPRGGVSVAQRQQRKSVINRWLTAIRKNYAGKVITREEIAALRPELAGVLKKDQALLDELMVAGIRRKYIVKKGGKYEVVDPHAVKGFTISKRTRSNSGSTDLLIDHVKVEEHGMFVNELFRVMRFEGGQWSTPELRNNSKLFGKRSPTAVGTFMAGLDFVEKFGGSKWRYTNRGKRAHRAYYSVEAILERVETYSREVLELTNKAEIAMLKLAVHFGQESTFSPAEVRDRCGLLGFSTDDSLTMMLNNRSKRLAETSAQRGIRKIVKATYQMFGYDEEVLEAARTYQSTPTMPELKQNPTPENQEKDPVMKTQTKPQDPNENGFEELTPFYEELGAQVYVASGGNPHGKEAYAGMQDHQAGTLRAKLRTAGLQPRAVGKGTRIHPWTDRAHKKWSHLLDQRDEPAQSDAIFDRSAVLGKIVEGVFAGEWYPVKDLLLELEGLAFLEGITLQQALKTLVEEGYLEERNYDNRSIEVRVADKAYQKFELERSVESVEAEDDVEVLAPTDLPLPESSTVETDGEEDASVQYTYLERMLLEALYRRDVKPALEVAGFEPQDHLTVLQALVRLLGVE